MKLFCLLAIMIWMIPAFSAMWPKVKIKDFSTCHPMTPHYQWTKMKPCEDGCQPIFCDIEIECAGKKKPIKTHLTCSGKEDKTCPTIEACAKDKSIKISLPANYKEIHAAQKARLKEEQDKK